MAQYRGTVKGGRSLTSRLGHKTTGLITECNGWNIGVTCVANYDPKTDTDVIEVYKTSGSGYGGNYIKIAEIKEK